MAEKKIAFDESTVAGSATARFVRVSPRRARLVADLIRYKSVGEAEALLKFSNKKSVTPAVKKLLDAAKAAVNHRQYPHIEELVIGDIRVDGGPMFKRGRAQSRGRPATIRRRTSHITIRLMPPA